MSLSFREVTHKLVLLGTNRGEADSGWTVGLMEVQNHASSVLVHTQQQRWAAELHHADLTWDFLPPSPHSALVAGHILPSLPTPHQSSSERLSTSRALQPI